MLIIIYTTEFARSSREGKFFGFLSRINTLRVNFISIDVIEASRAGISFLARETEGHD